MKILIATGIYPPEIGGPAEYAKHLAETWESQNHKVKVKVFSRFNFLPAGLRHVAYFSSILPAVIWANQILALDTFSAGLPTTFAAKLFGKKIILRTGGDFLWEAYVERTGKTVLLREFYQSERPFFSVKERTVFRLTRWVLQNVSAVVWSTEWQKNIFLVPYGLERQKHFIVENYYGPKIPSREPVQKNFIAMTRKLKWKHNEFLQKVFSEPELKEAGAMLDTGSVPHGEFLDKLAESYAVVIASLGDISPNTILDAIRCNKPFILTKENGLTPRIKEIGLFVDPLSLEDVKSKVLWLLEPANYESQRAKIANFHHTHTWEEMAEEYIQIWRNI